MSLDPQANSKNQNFSLSVGLSRAGTVSLRQRLLLCMLIGDVFFAYMGLSLGYFLRFQTPLKDVGTLSVDRLSFVAYQPVLILGVLFLVAAFFQQKLYNWKYLLRPRKLLPMTFQATTFWFVIYLCTSVVLKFEPQISRIFMACSFVSVTFTVGVWKWFFTNSIRRTGAAKTLSQKVLFVGWNQESAELADAIYGDESNPYSVLGWVDTSTENINTQTAPAIYGRLGALSELEAVISRDSPDILIIADLNLDRSTISKIAKLCEVSYVQLKVLPSMFQIFVSGLRLETISSKPLLGVEEMAIQRITGQVFKRGFDIVGALVGLILSAPLIAICALVIKRQDPGGPVFYKQTRSGLKGEPFTIYKLRSMKLNAETSGAQWATENDPRRLPIGKFMRETNLDELPQFWNILKGDMSLVGPRPERPELIEKFEREIEHYNHRHHVKPGLTGWAQVNGLRGNTDLSERIRYDVYYIENWTPWLDIYCLVMTFISRKNAY